MYLPDQHAIPYKIGMKRMPPMNLTVANTSFFSASFSYSTVKFSFQRNSFGLLMGSFYIPTGLFALLSNGSFIINPEIVSIKSKKILVLIWEMKSSNYEIDTWLERDCLHGYIQIQGSSFSHRV